MDKAERIMRTARKRRQRTKYGHYKFNPGYRGKGIVLETPCVCSCWLCANQRKYGKGDLRLTLQERKANEFGKGD